MSTPDRLGKYLIRGELGRGAMGIVYEGFDPLIERTVAIKVLHIEPANEALAAELRQRFRREAQAAGRLSHPNIVSVYDYGEAAELSAAFIAMELVRGSDLKQLFDGGMRFTLQDTGRIMSGLLAALQHAHERGVVHRDIKPGNILLPDDGNVKVTDFGIAKIDTSDLTQWGSVLGTVSHMSPEQMSGQPVDRRSDLFSCGVILYQLLTGERPFSGSPSTVMQKVLHQEPLAPSLIVVGLPPGIDAVVRRAMAKSPAQRFQTAADFAAALRGALDAAPPDPEATRVVPPAERRDAEATLVVAPPPSARPPAPRAALVGGLALAACAAAGAGIWWWLASRDAAPAAASIATVPAVAGALAASAGGSPQATGPVAAAVPASAPVAALPAPPPAPLPGRTPTTLPSADEIEQLAWVDAAKANTVAAYEAYLQAYPKGRFGSRARVRIAALQPPPSVAVAPPAPPRASAAKEPARPPERPTVVVAAPRPPEPRPPAASPRAEASPAPAPAAKVPPAPRPAPAPAPAPAPTDPRSVAKAEPECAEAARRGDPRCQVTLGLLYRFGKGVPQNPATAVGWFRKAAEQGFAAGQHELGVMHAAGIGVPTDLNEALRWFRKAAEQGEARSQNRLGQAYENGEGATRNLVLATDWYRKAADQGLAVAQNNLGRMYLHGRGVFKDTVKAAELLQKAADQGDANARFHLGWMYEKGDGKPRDSQQAARLYRQALAAGASLADRNRQAATAFLNTKPAP